MPDKDDESEDITKSPILLSPLVETKLVASNTANVKDSDEVRVGRTDPSDCSLTLIGATVEVRKKKVNKCPLDYDESILNGLVVNLLGTNERGCGRSCAKHQVASCGSQLEVGRYVCFVKEHFAWHGPPEDVLAVYFVEARMKTCKVGFLSQHLAKCAARNDGLIAQVTEKYSSDYRVCDSVAKRQMFHHNLGVCRATIIGMHNLFV
jgi:hypothetical protein